MRIFTHEKHFSNNHEKSSKSETGDSEDDDESSRSKRIVRINILLMSIKKHQKDFQKYKTIKPVMIL